MIGASSLESLVGRNPRSWIHVSDISKFDRSFDSLLDGKFVNDLEISLVNEKGQNVYVSLTTNIIENGDKKIFCLLRDISHKRVNIDSKRIAEQKKKDKLIQAIRAIRSQIKNSPMNV
jgi:hypothetical protein